MKRAGRILAVFLLLAVLAPCGAIDRPFVLGKGRYLSSGEQQGFLQLLDKGGLAEEKEKYVGAVQKIRAVVGQSAKIEVIEFIEFNSELAKPRSGYGLFMVCFACNEYISPELRAERRKINAAFYDIWTLSGYFLIVEKHPRNQSWRVLHSGGAE